MASGTIKLNYPIPKYSNMSQNIVDRTFSTTTEQTLYTVTEPCYVVMRITQSTSGTGAIRIDGKPVIDAPGGYQNWGMYLVDTGSVITAYNSAGTTRVLVSKIPI